MFHFDLCFSVTGDHHITWAVMCMHFYFRFCYFVAVVIVVVVVFFCSLRRSVWYFHFCKWLVYLAGSRYVRRTQNICFPLHCLFFILKWTKMQSENYVCTVVQAARSRIFSHATAHETKWIILYILCWVIVTFDLNEVVVCVMS